MTKAKFWREKTDEELKLDLISVKKKIFEIRAKKPIESIANPGELRKLKKDVARILTILRERRRMTDAEEKERKGKIADEKGGAEKS